MSIDRWLVILVQSVVVAWLLLFLATYFELSLVSEAWGVGRAR